MLVLWLGSREVIAGRITLGQFVAFNAYLTMLSWPMIAFGWVTNMMQRGMASLEADARGARHVRRPRRDCRTRGARRMPDCRSEAALRSRESGVRDIRGEIEFRDLVFSYGGTPVLEPRLGPIEAGQTVALVGVTGSGKSTLINLLARLHDPPPARCSSTASTSATCRSRGCAARLASCRRSRSCSPTRSPTTSPSGWTRSGREWAGGGRTRPEGRRGGERRDAGRRSRTGVQPKQNAANRSAAAVARLDKDVADFPKGYDTMVGERGITLSGGQKQRTAIARASSSIPAS